MFGVLYHFDPAYIAFGSLVIDPSASTLPLLNIRMRAFTIISKALLYTTVSLTFTNAAFIPLEWTRAAEALIKRAVTYGDTGKDIAKSSICNTDQKNVLEQSMVEVAKLAKAGSDGLSIILDMLTDEKSEYRALPEAERNR
ncbi:MAG: hypothetical protein Q9164_007962, partial [Protoblastenia rupestris]